MALQLYMDFLSPPCCAVYMFVKKNKIPLEIKLISLMDGEHHEEWFGKINPRRRVPALKDGDFCLAESIPIMEYLAVKFNTADHWFPKDLKKQARVKEFNSWVHLGARLPGEKVFWVKTMAPALKLEAPDHKIAAALENANSCLDQIEKSFIQDGGFIGGKEISIADLVAVAEVMQFISDGVDVFKGRPKLSAWKERVVQAVGKELFDETLKMILSQCIKTIDPSKLEQFRKPTLREIS